jgi:hypothetical protein
MSDYTDHVIDDPEHTDPDQEDIGWFDPDEAVDEEPDEDTGEDA